jgi:hypothetical protein
VFATGKSVMVADTKVVVVGTAALVGVVTALVLALVCEVISVKMSVNVFEIEVVAAAKNASLRLNASATLTLAYGFLKFETRKLIFSGGPPLKQTLY